MIVAWAVFGPATAHAYTLDLKPMTCAAGAESLAEAFALSERELACGPHRFDERAPFVRTATRLEGRKLALGSGLVWQTEAAAFSSILVRFTYADGSTRLVDIDPQMTARNWFPANRFSVDVPSSSSALVAVDAVVEKPFTRGVAADARVMTRADSVREQYRRSLAYVFMLGLLILPLLYDFLFYRVLRQSFVLWHSGMIATTTLFMLFSSGLVNEIVPDLPLEVRWRLTTLSLALAAGCGAMLVAGLIEDRFLPPRLARAMMASALLPLLVKVVATVGGESLRIAINDWFVFSFLPVVALISVVVAVALAKGSRGAAWALAGMGGLVLVIVLRTLAALDVLALPFPMNDMVFAGFVLLSLVTAVAVGDRFTGLKQDRDAARMRAIKMGQMANTDGMTGLANRRAFDMVPKLKAGQGLLVADIDHFKQVNDRYGHQVGDAVLCDVAGCLRGNLTGIDGPEESAVRGTVYRLGGEEFAAIVDVMEAHELVSLAERLRVIVANSENPDMPNVTLSFGAVLGHGQLMHEAFGAADKALYRAKREGRNRVLLADGVDSDARAEPKSGKLTPSRA